jgi:hypothetical protein
MAKKKAAKKSAKKKPTPKKKKKRVNRLSYGQNYAVGNYITDRWDEFKGHGYTYTEVAACCLEDLKFKVVPSTIRRIAKSLNLPPLTNRKKKEDLGKQLVALIREICK